MELKQLYTKMEKNLSSIKVNKLLHTEKLFAALPILR
jgi:hypothetical protein